MDISKLEVRPRGFRHRFEDINAFFTSSYIFASQYISDKNVLDSGCGTGYGAKYLAECGAHSVIGIDVDSEIIRKCKEHYRDIENLEFMLSDPWKLEFENDFFDVVVSMEVIEHIREYKRYLEEIHRVLKGRGRLIIATPNKNIFSPRSEKPIMISHEKEFYPEEFAFLLAEYFSSVKMYGKHVLNDSYLEKSKKIESSLRYFLTKNLAQFDFVKTVGKYIPYSIRKFVSGMPPVQLKIKDILISENNIDKAHSLIAVCCK